jgi:hypothetical protein
MPYHLHTCGHILNFIEIFWSYKASEKPWCRLQIDIENIFIKTLSRIERY